MHEKHYAVTHVVPHLAPLGVSALVPLCQEEANNMHVGTSSSSYDGSVVLRCLAFSSGVGALIQNTVFTGISRASFGSSMRAHGRISDPIGGAVSHGNDGSTAEICTIIEPLASILGTCVASGVCRTGVYSGRGGE